jgi:hypothetical protein
MDPERFRDAYDRLRLLDERLTHRIRPRPGGGLLRPSSEQIEERLRDLASYVVDLKDILEELFEAIGGRPKQGSE